MEKSIISTGKTIDAATEAALERLGLDRDSVSVEVLETPRSGFFGIGAVPAKIRVSYELPDLPEPEPTPAPALSSASRNVKPSEFVKRQAERQKAEEEKMAAAKAAAKAAIEAAAQSQPEVPASHGKEENRQRRETRRNDRRPKTARPAAVTPAPKPVNKAPKPPKPAYVPPQPGSMEERIETYLNGLLAHMGSVAKAQAVKTDTEQYHVELVGEDLGMLIGRRGETLDALQHLVNYTVGRGESRHLRVTVDAENYRDKREESLERLAYKVAAKVLKYRRNWTMEPMNAYERHVIHAALQDYDGVSTYSTGTEPNRRVVVAYGNNKTAPGKD